MTAGKGASREAPFFVIPRSPFFVIPRSAATRNLPAYLMPRSLRIAS
jgi:hypothetical protein